MSAEQYNVQARVFSPDNWAKTREEAIRELQEIGVCNIDGTLTEEYQFMDPNWRPTPAQ